MVEEDDPFPVVEIVPKKDMFIFRGGSFKKMGIFLADQPLVPDRSGTFTPSSWKTQMSNDQKPWLFRVCVNFGCWPPLKFTQKIVLMHQKTCTTWDVSKSNNVNHDRFIMLS